LAHRVEEARAVDAEESGREYTRTTGWYDAHGETLDNYERTLREAGARLSGRN